MDYSDLTKSFPPELLCSGGNFRTFASEFFVLCPYDSNHRALNHRFSEHLRRCRQNYEIKKIAEGQHPVTLCCRYNKNHRVYGPELGYHEYSCRDKKLPWLDRIYSEHREALEAICQLGKDKSEAKRGAAGGKAEVEVTADVKNMIAELQKPEAAINYHLLGHMGVTPAELQDLTHRLMQMVRVGQAPSLQQDVIWPDPEETKDTKGPFSRIRNCSMELFDQTADPTAFGYIHRRGWVHRRTRLSERKDPALARIPEDEIGDDKDNWESDKGPGFDWNDHQRKICWRGLSRLIPPGLVKSERKQFELANSERLKHEEGIFSEDEEDKKKKKDKKKE